MAGRQRKTDTLRKATFVPPGGGAHLGWLGERLRYLAVGEQSLGRFAVSVGVVPPGGGPPPHVQSREHEGFFVLSGELTFTAGNRNLTLPAGGFLNVAPGTPHHFTNSGTEPAEVLVIVGPAGFDEFQFRAGLPLSGPDEPVPPVTDDDRSLLASVAPEYGVRLDPPPSAFAAAPRIRLTLPGEGPLVAAAGDLYRFLGVSNDTDGTYALWHAQVPAGGGPPAHLHRREDEAMFVLSGSVTFRSDGSEETLGPGGFVLLPAGTNHQFANDTDETATLLILVAPAGLEEMFQRTGVSWSDADTLPGPISKEEIDRLIAIAPEYGIELHP